MAEKEICGIYKIIDTINNKVYIGATHSIFDRWDNHKSSWKSGTGNKGLCAAYKENGIESFKFEIVEECDSKLLNKRERFYIKKLDSTNADKGYNIALPSARIRVPKCKTCSYHEKQHNTHFCTINPNVSFNIMRTKEMQPSPKWCQRRLN